MKRLIGGTSECLEWKRNWWFGGGKIFDRFSFKKIRKVTLLFKTEMILGKNLRKMDQVLCVRRCSLLCAKYWNKIQIGQ